MGLPKEEDRFADRLDRTREFFEPQLRALGLGLEELREQSLDELYQSLERINDAIAHPESFGTLKLRASLPLFTSSSEAQMELGVLPVLLERKKLTLERITELRSGQKIDNLRDLVAQVADEGLKTVLQQEVVELESTREFQAQAEQVEKQQQTLLQQFEIRRQQMQLDMERFERRSQVWRAFLERESVATIVGGMLLLILAVVLTVAMFTDVAATAVISNSFLLILGYFFGQTVARDSARGANG